MQTAFLAPLRLSPNRVYRFYKGGMLLDRYRGEAKPKDGSYPEDWIGSITAALNPADKARAREGLSSIDTGSRSDLIRDLLRAYPNEVAGADVVSRFGVTTALLVKLLDAAIRLPVHIHPTREFAARVLGSSFGKAEAWVILETRQLPGAEAPNVRLGFRKRLSRERLRHIIDAQDSRALLEAMNAVPVTPGDVLFVRPGLPHAIGAGVLLLEVQEPTDYTVVLEWAGYPISPTDAHLGRGWATMLDCIDRTVVDRALLASLMPHPRTVIDAADISVVALLASEADDFFHAYRVEVHGRSRWPFDGRYAIGILLGGNGTISNQHGELSVRTGDSFGLFASAPASFVDGDCQLAVFTPPGAGVP